MKEAAHLAVVSGAARHYRQSTMVQMSLDVLLA